MTVRELKDILETYPNNYLVYTIQGYAGESATSEAMKVKTYLPYNSTEDKRGIILEED